MFRNDVPFKFTVFIVKVSGHSTCKIWGFRGDMLDCVVFRIVMRSDLWRVLYMVDVSGGNSSMFRVRMR